VIIGVKTVNYKTRHPGARQAEELKPLRLPRTTRSQPESIRIFSENTVFPPKFGLSLINKDGREREKRKKRNEWEVRVGRLKRRFGKSGVARKLGLVQIVVEASAIRGGFPNTQPSEPVSGLRCRSVLMGLWGGAVHPTAWMKIYANFKI